MNIYVFLKYPWDKRWFRSRPMYSGLGIANYIRTLDSSVKIRIAMR